MHPRNARDAASSGPNMERDPVALALIDHLERSFGSEPRWSVRDGGRLLWSPHHLAVEVSVRPRHGADGAPVYVVTSTVEIAFGLDASRYLPMLARHARRLDAVAALTMSDDGRTTTTFEHVLHPGPEQPARIEAIRDRVAIQALQSEALLLLAQVEGVVGDANLPPERGPSPGLLDRPDALLGHARVVARDGLRKVATVGLTGESKLGPWFLGTEQDAMLEERMARGWTREADAAAHEVYVRPPSDAGPIQGVHVRWAHQSEQYGPALLLGVVSAARLGADPASTLRSLNRLRSVPVVHARLGSWLPAAWLDPDVVCRAAVAGGSAADAAYGLDPDDRAAWVVSVPTALARPGGLAQHWRWAESEVRSALATRTLN